MSKVIKVVDLLAQFGLDAGPLIKGLEDTELRIDQVGARVTGVNALLKQLGEGSIFGTKFQQQFDDIRAAAQLAYEQNVSLATQEKEINKMLVAENKAAMEEKKADRASYIAWWKRTLDEQAAEEKAIQTQLAFDEKRNIEDQKAERARYIAWWSRALREQEESEILYAKMVSESQIGSSIASALARIANEEKVAAATEAASGRMIVSNFKVRTEAQALNEMLGTKIPGSVSRLVAFSPLIAQAMEAAFDVVLVGAFVDILIHVDSELEQLIRDAEGFDKASIKAWDDARAGSEKATASLLKYNAAQREVAAAGLKGAGKFDTEGKIAGANLEDQKHHLNELQDQAKQISKLLSQAGFTGPGFGDASLLTRMGVGGIINPEMEKANRRIKDQGDTVETLAERYKHLQDEIRETATEIGKLGQTIEKDKLKEERAPIRGQHKLRGPEDNEEPYRLPWYLGPNAAQSFANRVHAQRMSGLPSPASRVQTGSNQGGMSSQTASVQVQTTISPQFVFHGIPADIQAFMRDHAEPQLAKDIANNIRGIGDRVVKALKESGMAVV